MAISMKSLRCWMLVELLKLEKETKLKFNFNLKCDACWRVAQREVNGFGEEQKGFSCEGWGWGWIQVNRNQAGIPDFSTFPSIPGMRLDFFHQISSSSEKTTFSSAFIPRRFTPFSISGIISPLSCCCCCIRKSKKPHTYSSPCDTLQQKKHPNETTSTTIEHVASVTTFLVSRMNKIENGWCRHCATVECVNVCKMSFVNPIWCRCRSKMPVSLSIQELWARIDFAFGTISYRHRAVLVCLRWNRIVTETGGNAFHVRCSSLSRDESPGQIV